MNDIFEYFHMHRYFSCMMIILNLVFSSVFIKKITIFLNKTVREGRGGRNEEISLYKKCTKTVAQSIEECEKRAKKYGLYVGVKEKMKKSGYRNQYAAVIYILLKYGATSIIFFVSLAINYPDTFPPIILLICCICLIEIVLIGRRKKLNLNFQKNAYKIYKYLHNQISSGVKATDAIKTVYDVIDDRKLKKILIQLAARYELTLDIDFALEEFKSNFNVQEAETFCIALKQGILTGDNRDLLKRQEDVMFKKYFNYIQAETDACKTRTVTAAVIFTSITVIMIMIPLLNDASDAVSKIFVN